MSDPPGKKPVVYRFDFCCWDEETYYLPASNDIDEPHSSDESAIVSAECHIGTKLKHPRIVKVLCIIQIVLGKYKLGRHVKTITRAKEAPTKQYPRIPN